MMRAPLILLNCIFAVQTMADDVSEKAIPVYPLVCKEGLYRQPKGHLRVAVFDDDAAGTHIAVIFHSPHEDDLYWQEPGWSVDVTAFWWGLNGNYLYVSTNGIYGTGLVYELDLAKRKSRPVIPKSYPPTDRFFCSEILRYNAASKSLECEVEYLHRDKKKTVKEVIKIPVKLGEDNKRVKATRK